ncbi:MAG TPA: chemotaxis protein CheW [Bryobacteraceae bacterium]
METRQEIPATRARQYMTFRVARQDFVMDAAAVRGILPARELYRVESTPGLARYYGKWICGFTTMRGNDVPIIDLRAKLNLPHATQGRNCCIVVVEVPGPDGARLAGFVADRVADIVEARPRDFSDGRLRLHGRPRRLLDPQTLLS